MSEAVGSLDIMEFAVELARTGQSYALATVVWRKPPSSGQPGSKAVITSDGQLHGWIGGACAEPVVVREAKRVLAAGEPALIWLGQEGDFEGMHVPQGVMTIPMSCQSEGALQLYIEPVLVAPEVLVVGRSPMVTTLLELVRGVGWRGEIIDGPDFQPHMVGSASIVIVATQGHGDEEALETAIKAEPAFIGLVASEKRGDAVRGFLIDKGIPAEKLSRVQAPVGIDLGHTTHREMAVSILGKLVQMRAAGELSQPWNTSGVIVEPEEVRDLVCGMTVEAVPANRPLEHEGIVYYFCAPGCRVAFEKEPNSFTKQEARC
jgi:xanthine dehydrogenase accessory factor